MENNEQKTPEQWFQMLKEPYRSEAIANIDVNRDIYEKYPKSFYNALYNSFLWSKSKQGRDYWYKIQLSIQAGETTYLETETELKPQDMISGEWYVIETNNKFLIKFKTIEGGMVIKTKCYIYNKERKSDLNALCYCDDIKSIRPATREEVLEHFPNEFQEEKKEVESELECYFYSIDHVNYSTSDLQAALNDADNGTIIYKATPIGTKQTKSILEPINK